MQDDVPGRNAVRLRDARQAGRETFQGGPAGALRSGSRNDLDRVKGGHRKRHAILIPEPQRPPGIDPLPGFQLSGPDVGRPGILNLGHEEHRVEAHAAEGRGDPAPRCQERRAIQRETQPFHGRPELDVSIQQLLPQRSLRLGRRCLPLKADEHSRLLEGLAYGAAHHRGFQSFLLGGSVLARDTPARKGMEAAEERIRFGAFHPEESNSGCAGDEHEARRRTEWCLRQRYSTRTGGSASRRARMCSGPVPQQPPMICAPRASQVPATSANRSGVQEGSKHHARLSRSGSPALG